jgi:hypothetical protein
MQLTSVGAMVRALLAGLVLLAVTIGAVVAVSPSGEDLVYTVLWIVTMGVLAAGLALAVRAGRPLAGVGAALVSAGALLAFYWKPWPSSAIWSLLFLAGALLTAYGTRADAWTPGAWPLLLVRLGIGWGWFDNAQDHLRGQGAWLPGGGGFLNLAKNAAARGSGAQGAQPLAWFGDPAYVGFLRDVVVPNGDVWAGLTLCGEMTFGILLAVGLLTPVASVGSLWQSANYILMKGLLVHGAYTDKVFFLLAAFCFVTAAGLNYGLDASLRRSVGGWFSETFMGVPGRPSGPLRVPQPSPAPA